MYNIEGETHLVLAVENNGAYRQKGHVISLFQGLKSTLGRAGVDITDIGFDPCVSEPCLNNGACSSALQVFEDELNIIDSPELIFTSHLVRQLIQCDCTGTEYKGEFCEIPKNKCLDNQCKNGGTCVQLSGSSRSYRCDCGVYWTGEHCTDDVNECFLPNPCSNQGQCHNLEGSYQCTCNPRYTGKDCESEINLCSSLPCLNDARCVPVSESDIPDFRCRCASGDRGRTCDVLSRTFASLSFMEYEVPLQLRSNKIELEFRTNSDNALLIFMTPGGASDVNNAQQFMALEIVSGNVRFSFLLGSDSLVQINVNMLVNTGQWYHVEAVRNEDRGELKVSHCKSGSETCDLCYTGDQSCYASTDQRVIRPIGYHSAFTSVGGIHSLDSLLNHPGWLNTHDLVGCLRGIRVNSRNLFDSQALRQQNVTNHCSIEDNYQSCDVTPCQNSGVCIPGFNEYRCQCTNTYMGANCEHAKQPLTFGDNAKVTYKQKETYRRDQLLNKSVKRRKRSTEVLKTRKVFLRFKSVEDSGMLFHAISEGAFTILQVYGGKLEYHSKVSQSLTPLHHNTAVNDGEWHNVTLTIKSRSITLDVDGTLNDLTVSRSLHDFYGLDVSQMFIGGNVDIELGKSKSAKGFSGCISNFKIDGEELPFVGSTERFDIEVTGEIENSCPSNGTKGASLHIGIIVIIVFFALVLIALLVVFAICRWRKKQKKEQPTENSSSQELKTISNGFIDPGVNGNSLEKNHYNREVNQENLENIRRNIELVNGNYNEREVTACPTQSQISQRPDIIAPETNSLQMEIGTMQLDGRIPNGHANHSNGHENLAFKYDLPAEMYDIDNASSIVPSDVEDVVKHYRHYRMNGGSTHQHLPNVTQSNKHPHRRVSPSPITQLHMQNRQVLGMKNNSALLGQSHSHLSHSGSPLPLTSSPLTVQNVANLSRKSPNGIHGHMNTRPVSAVPFSALDRRGKSPSHGRSLGSTPNPFYEPGSNASHSSHSYVDRPASVPVGGIMNQHPHGRLRQKQQNHHHFGANHRLGHVPGLSVDDVNHINNRRAMSPSHMLDALSSSSDGRHVHRPHKVVPDLYEPVSHLVAAGIDQDSSSEDGGSNDSFTCSEFEYEPDHTRPTTNRSFGQLAQVAENDSELEYRSQSRGAGVGSDSNHDGSISTFPTSDEEQNKSYLTNRPQSAASKLLNGMALNWDCLLNWGPNFEKLVGVFEDIAELPDDFYMQTPQVINVYRPPSQMSNNYRPPSQLSHRSNSQLSSPNHMAGGLGGNHGRSSAVSFESNAREEYV